MSTSLTSSGSVSLWLWIVRSIVLIGLTVFGIILVPLIRLARLAATERRAFLDQVCSNDMALRKRVEALRRMLGEVGGRIAGWKSHDCPGIRRTICLTALLALSCMLPTLDGEVSRVGSGPANPAGPPGAPTTQDGMGNADSAFFEAIAQDDVEQVRALLEANPRLANSTGRIGMATPLLLALQSTTPKVAELLLAHGADINARVAGVSPVYYATMCGNLEMVTFLLDRGADMKLTGQSGASLLHAAVIFADKADLRALLLKTVSEVNRTPQFGKVLDAGFDLIRSEPAQRKAVVELLLALGLDVNAKDALGRTPLNFAARVGEAAISETLLDHQAEINTPDLEGFTPLHTAAESGRLSVVELLLARGADFSLSSNDGRTPLYSGAAGGNVEVVKLLLDRQTDVNGRENAHRRTPLHNAALHGHDGVVELLLARKAEVDATADDGWTPLHYAAATRLIPDKAAWESSRLIHRISGTGHKRAAELLIAHHAGINARSKFGVTPLHVAAMMDNLPVAEVLLAHKVEVDPRTRGGETPLQLAAAGGSMDLLQQLLDHGADPTAVGARKAQLLHYAAEGGNVQIVDLLLDRGAAPDAQDLSRNTPLHLAASKGNAAVVESLLRNGATVDQPGEAQRTALHFAASSGRLDVLQVLINKGANLQSCEVHQATPLHLAVLNRQPAAVRFLLEQRADVSARDMARQTPLHLAALSGDPAVARILLEFHAPLDAKAKSGDTPLHFAVMVRQPGRAPAAPQNAPKQVSLQQRIDLVNLLVEAGSDLTATTAIGDTPFDVALSFGTKETAKLVRVVAPWTKPAP